MLQAIKRARFPSPTTVFVNMHCVSLCILVSIFASCRAQIWPETERKFDIIFLLETAPPPTFLAIKTALLDVAAHVSMVNDVHLGAVSFDGALSGTIPLTGSTATFTTAVGGLVPTGTPGRRLDLALQEAMTMMTTFGGGRPGVDKLVICLLTAPSNNAAATMASAHNLRVAYIQIAALGIGVNPALVDEMNEIASDASRMVKLNNAVPQFNANYESQIAHIFQVAGICSECRWDNSIHFVPDPADCNAFFECTSVDNKIKNHCSLGQFWDRVALTCRPAEDVQCKDDPCVYHAGLTNYGDVLQRNCAYFWTCGAGSRTDGYGCCSGTETFQPFPFAVLGGHPPPSYPLGSCVALATPCTDACPLVYPTFTGPAAPQAATCYPEVYLDFTGNVQGHGPYMAYIQNRGVTIANSVGIFNGQADLISPRFAHAWFGRYVQIFVRFMPDTTVTGISKTEMLVANGDCGEQHTIFIGYNRVQQEIIVKFNADVLATGVVQNVPGTWIEVRVLYDGNAGDLTVDVTEFPAGGGTLVKPQLVLPLSGPIKQALPALHIGGYTDASTNQYENLHGWIDTFWIYLCKPVTIFVGK